MDIYHGAREKCVERAPLGSRRGSCHQFPPPAQVQSDDLIDKLINSNFPPSPDPSPFNNPILVSFDVVSPYPNIPIPHTLQLIRNTLSAAEIPSPVIDEFMRLLTLCITPNFGKFNDKIYTVSGNIGVFMGSPLAPLFSEIFMDNFERTILSSSNPHTQYIHYWHRYVDDVLCMWIGQPSQLHNFLNFLNSHHPSIKFTMEIGDKQINFLDLSISLNNNKHHFDIFRKPTCTDITIHGSSYAPPAHKFAAYYTMINRLLHTPLSHSAFRNEVNTIKLIAQNNQINLNIDNLLSGRNLFLAIETLPQHSHVCKNPAN